MKIFKNIKKYAWIFNPFETPMTYVNLGFIIFIIVVICYVIADKYIIAW